MSTFITVTEQDKSRPTLVNVAHIIRIETLVGGEGEAFIELTGEIYMTVDESMEEIQDMLIEVGNVA